MSRSVNESVWVSRDPAIVALWDKWVEDHREYRRQGDKLLADLGLQDRDLIEMRATALGGDDYLIGVSLHSGDGRQLGLPSGDWRMDHGGCLPKRRTATQRALYDRFHSVRRPDLRADLPGMPRSAMRGLTVMAPGVEKIDNAMYVIWDDEVVGIDENVWTRVKMSEYWAAKEEAKC
jgi:hypothetical protein